MLYLEISFEQDANDEVGSPFPRDIDWRAVCSQEKATSPRSIGFPHIRKYSIIWSADRVTSHRAYRSVMQTVKDLLMARAQSSSLFGFSPRSSSCLSAYIEFNFSFGVSTRQYHFEFPFGAYPWSLLPGLQLSEGQCSACSGLSAPSLWCWRILSEKHYDVTSDMK